jgi:hypothetical protein
VSNIIFLPFDNLLVFSGVDLVCLLAIFNIAERVLKLPIRNRKSAKFYKTLKSALLASYVQSLLFSAAQNNINPFEYMKEILVRKDIVKKSPTKWLPWNYLESIQALDDSNFLQEDSS